MSSLLDDILELEQKKKKTKWQILKEHEKEILMMIDKNFSIKEQVDLILKNEILEKLDYKEYRNILIKHFGYKSKSTKDIKSFATTNNPATPTTNKKHTHRQQKTNPAKSAKDILSEEVSLI